MSLRMAIGAARLTVLGSGWSDTTIESGDGFTIEGDLLDDIATELGFDIGKDTDWDLIVNNEMPDFDLSKVIFVGDDGTVYTDPGGTGIWTDPTTGLEYPGGGKAYIPEDMMIDVSDMLHRVATEDSALARYSIPSDVIPTLYGGRTGTEIHCLYPGDSDRPHYYSPPIWYIQTNNSTGYTFLNEPFFHGTASGGSITVYDVAITIRRGSSKTVYYSDCTTHFTDNYLPSPYNSYPIQYVCWQCLYGSLGDALIATNPSTVTTESIRNGTSGLETIDYAEQRYYRMKDRQVADRV